ncbi:MAG: 3-oxoadipate enol-lactonase [Pseudomonadota bacterium]
MDFARGNGITLHYRDRGPSDGGKGTILFVNSLGTDFRIWDAVADGLIGDWRCIQYDKRGHGLSEATPAPYTMEQLVNDAVAVLDHCKADPVVVCGVSVGGLIGQGLANWHGDRVRGLVLCDTGAKIGDAALWEGRITTAERAGTLEALADATAERWFPAAFRSAEPIAVSGYRAMFARTPVVGYCGTSAAIRDCDFRETSKQISVPTSVIWGAEDAATPPELNRALQATIEGAEGHELAGVGHIPSLQEPGRMVELVRALAEATL